jgi:hypothetical protein
MMARNQTRDGRPTPLFFHPSTFVSLPGRDDVDGCVAVLLRVATAALLVTSFLLLALVVVAVLPTEEGGGTVFAAMPSPPSSPRARRRRLARPHLVVKVRTWTSGGGDGGGKDDDDDDDGDDECPICLAPLVAADAPSGGRRGGEGGDDHEVVETDCAHLYHRACLRSWLRATTNRRRACALCRHRLPVRTKWVVPEGEEGEAGEAGEAERRRIVAPASALLASLDELGYLRVP